MFASVLFLLLSLLPGRCFLFSSFFCRHSTFSCLSSSSPSVSSTAMFTPSNPSVNVYCSLSTPLNSSVSVQSCSVLSCTYSAPVDCSMWFLCSVNGQAPTVTIMMTDPHTYSRRFIKAERDQDVVMDCYVENLPAATTVSLVKLLHFSNVICIVYGGLNAGLDHPKM